MTSDDERQGGGRRGCMLCETKMRTTMQDKNEDGGLRTVMRDKNVDNEGDLMTMRTSGSDERNVLQSAVDVFD